MPQLTARQLVYSRVEAQYSPRSQSGYQVVYQSPDLPATDVNTIEKRVQCFQPKSGEVRYQFFTLDSGRIVVSYSEAITDPDPEITDRNRRSGAFIAHCLILEPGEFQKVRNDPFAILDQSQLFIKDVNEMIALQNKGEPHPYKFNVSRRTTCKMIDWSPEAIEQFCAMAEQAPTLKAEKRSLILLGDETEIYDTLSFFLHIVQSPQKRILLTFDTCVDGCNPAPGLYWSVGGARRISNTKFVTVDLRQPHIEHKDIKLPDPKGDNYVAWLMHSLNDLATRDVVDQAFTVQIVTESFVENRMISASDQPDLTKEGISSYFSLYRAQINEGLNVALEDFLGKEARARFIADVEQTSLTHIDILNAAAQHSFKDSALLAEAVYSWIIDVRHPIEKEATGLQKLAEIASHWPLLLVASFTLKTGFLGLGSGKKEKIRLEALTQLQQTGQLEKVLNDLWMAFEWAKPFQFVAPQTVPIVVAYCQTHHLTNEEQFTQLVTTIMAQGGGKDLSPLIPELASLSKNALQAIAKSMQKHSSEIPHDFARYVDQRLTTLK